MTGVIVYLTGPEESYICLYSHTIIKSTHLEAQNSFGDDTLYDPSVISTDSNKAQIGHKGYSDHTADEWTSSDMNRGPLILNTIYSQPSQAGQIAL